MESRAFFSFISPFLPYSMIFIASLYIMRVIKTLIYPHSNLTLFRRHKVPPGPKPWPIIGNLPEMLSSKSASKWIHQIMKNFNTEIACIKLGNVHVIPVSNPAIACEFLKKQDDIFASRPISMASCLLSRAYSTTAALTPYGEQWKKMEKMVVKELLSPTKHRWLHDKRMEEADNLVRYVYMSQNNNAQGLVDVRIAQHYSANVIRKMIFNKRYFGEDREDGGPGSEEIEYVDALFTMHKYLYAFSVSDYVPCLRGLDLDGHKRLLKNATMIVNKYHDPIIEHRIKQWKKEGTITEAEDLLDVMISLKDARNNPLLTMGEIKAEM